ncbi:uncharacterized protein LOC135202672 isoform X1 [Macrobrachium nipponense]|uniref:uncharacterized protein LOC135202672 isoform X1 n=1 Tax=Macrobrachium nipponense TaxID=159736 RepID=UPI0030C88560
MLRLSRSLVPFVTSAVLLCLIYKSDHHQLRQMRLNSLEHLLSISEQDKETMVSCEVSFKLGKCSCTRTIFANVPPDACPNVSSPAQAILKEIKTRYGASTCGDWATLRGPNQKVVSYSIYGPYPTGYYDGMNMILPRIEEVYPGWVTRLYYRTDESNPNITRWMCDLACKHPHLDLCDVERLPVFGNITYSVGRVWRFATMGDNLVDKFMVRDSDSPILQREVDAVNEWLADGTCFHVMRDHPFHGIPMLAGMWGGCNTWKPDQIFNVTARILRESSWSRADQPVMGRRLWPIASMNITPHDAYSCRSFGKNKPFPSKRVNFTYIGEKSYMKAFKRPKTFWECPVYCRPKDHQDWKYC